MGMAQVPQDSWNETSDPPRQAEFVAALKESNRFVEISFAEVEIPETARRGHEAVRLVHRLCNLYPFFSPDDSLGELSTRGKHVDQPDPGHNREQIRLAEAFADQVAFECLDVAPEIFPRTRILAKTEIGLPQTEIRYDPEGEISTGRGGGEGAAASLDSVVEIARYPETVSHEGGDPTQPALIADLFGENLAFAKVIEDSPGLSEREERIAKLQQEIDPLLDRSSALRQFPEGFERLLEARDGFSMGQAGGSLHPGLTAVGDGLVPDRAPEGMVGEAIDLLGQPVGIDLFDRPHDPSVELLPSVLGETRVGDLVSERVLECVFHLGDETRLVHELAALQLHEAGADLWQLRHCLEQSERHVLADDGCGLQK